jgi:hypothetical protein
VWTASRQNQTGSRMRIAYIEGFRSLGETTTTILAEMDLLTLAVRHMFDVLWPHCLMFGLSICSWKLPSAMFLLKR